MAGLVLAVLMCTPGIASAYSVGWYEPFPPANITTIEAYITGGTFTGPLSSFTQGNNNLGPPLVGWSSFVAGNYPGTAVVGTGPAFNAVSFFVNFIGDAASISFYAMDTGRNVIFSECYNFVNGSYTTECVVGSLPTLAPSAVPIPAAVWLFGSGLIGLVGVGRRRKAA
ncbi:MAG: VPLPA-CTERM sorting domain-containing protein [Planctomycetes bacterium]|jgi:hypothetical protein|nr:VPLPA-CTERM sorting domain-containing protein [Planctomycetota bacterium]